MKPDMNTSLAIVLENNINRLGGKYKSSIIPNPYFIKQNSLYRKDLKKIEGEYKDVVSLVSRYAPIISKIFEHFERGEVHYEVTWSIEGRVYKEIVPAGTLASKRELLKLADKGFSVTDLNAKHLVEYFDLFLVQNRIERQNMVDRIGKVKNEFIHPLLTNEFEIVPLDSGEQQLLESFKVMGTTEGWIKNVYNLVKEHPKVVFNVLASFGSSVLHEFNIKPFIIDTSGRTSTGKSAVLRIAASVWASPEEYIGTFNITPVAVERRSAFLNSFVHILDDTNGSNDLKKIQQMIYQFVNMTGKFRGSIAGSQKTASWNSILLTSGENEILEYTTAAGVAGRVIPLTNFIFKDEDVNFLGNVYSSFRGDHGAIGIEFIKRWKEKRKIYIPMYKEYEELFLKMSEGNDVMQRLSRIYAYPVFIGAVLNDMFKEEGLVVDLNAQLGLFKEMKRENRAVDRPLQELEKLLEEIDANRDHLFDMVEPQHETYAFFHNGEFYFSAPFLKKRLGVNGKQIRSSWMEKGITYSLKDKNGFVDHKVINKNKKYYRGIMVNKDVIASFNFNFSESKYTLKEEFSSLNDEFSM